MRSSAKPAKRPQAVERVHHARPARSPTADRGEDARLARFAELVTSELGIRMPPSKLNMLRSRIGQRMRSLNIQTLEDYERYLSDPLHGAQEFSHFVDVVTTNKTDFFREPRHFELLTHKILPALGREHNSQWTCRVWCAGCSSGQEVYTLAMVLSEYAARHESFKFSIWATDVSGRMLEKAQAAIYEHALVEPVPLELRQKYLLRSKDRTRDMVRIDRKLRAHVQFARLNFLQPNYKTPGPFDVIFFRNVMIYFDKPVQQQVVEQQCRHLREGGYFFISHTESLAGLQLPLQSLGMSVFRKKS